MTFNLDEYLGLGPDRLQSYHRWMHEHFFKFVNIPPENIHIPDGMTPPDKLDEHCRDYERRSSGPAASTSNCWASAATGTSASTSRSAPATAARGVATLDPLTRRDAASDFFSEENVPMQAITMGLGTIFEARKIVLIALGEHKAGIIRETAEGRDHAPRAGHVSARAPERGPAVGHGRRRQADRRGHALAVGQGRVDRRADQAGRAVAERASRARPC